jgi:hypothetical protein
MRISRFSKVLICGLFLSMPVMANETIAVETESEMVEEVDFNSMKCFKSDDCVLYFSGAVGALDDAQDPIVCVTCYFDNNANIAHSAASIFTVEAYQDGIQLKDAYFPRSGFDKELDKVLSKAEPYLMSFDFKLRNMYSDVDLIFSPVASQDDYEIITCTIDELLAPYSNPEEIKAKYSATLGNPK